MPAKSKPVFIDLTEEQIMDMTREEVIMHLHDREVTFCEHYIRNKNIKIAAIAAGYKPTSAHIVGWKIRQKPEVQLYIAWLKLRIIKKHSIEADDFIDHYARIAFADITDFVKVENGRVKLVNAELMDGQIVKSIKHGRDGITIELYDKLAAMNKLEQYFDVMPADWRQKIEQKKLEIAQKHLELEMKKIGEGGDEQEDDGFIEALKGEAKEVWGSAEEIEE